MTKYYFRYSDFYMKTLVLRSGTISKINIKKNLYLFLLFIHNIYSTYIV